MKGCSYQFEIRTSDDELNALPGMPESRFHRMNHQDLRDKLYPCGKAPNFFSIFQTVLHRFVPQFFAKNFRIRFALHFHFEQYLEPYERVKIIL